MSFSPISFRRVSWSDDLPAQLGLEEIHLWAIPLFPSTNVSPYDWAKLCQQEIERAKRFHFEEHRARFVQSHAFLRRVLARYTGNSPVDIAFNVGPFGKPTLAGNPLPSAIEFNLSHCDQFALLGVTSGNPIGVDVETVRPMPDIDQMSRQFFSKAEYETLASTPEHQKDLAFFNCWTRKEAMIKAIGSGLSIPLDSFEVTLVPGEHARLLQLDGDEQASSAWHLRHLELAPNVVGALAVRFAIRGVASFLIA